MDRAALVSRTETGTVFDPGIHLFRLITRTRPRAPQADDSQLYQRCARAERSAPRSAGFHGAAAQFGRQPVGLFGCATTLVVDSRLRRVTPRPDRPAAFARATFERTAECSRMPVPG